MSAKREIFRPRIDQVASFTTPGHLVFILGDLPDDQFRGVAQALTGSISSRFVAWIRHLAGGYGD
jgi:hypothetical protein